MLRRPIALILGLVASAAVCVSVAFGGVPPGDTQLQQACSATANSIQKVVVHAATPQVRVITAQLRVVVPGTVSGRIAFNPTGSTIHVAADPTQAGFGCANGAVPAGVHKTPGHSQVVSRLRKTFTAAGLYTLTFDLNAVGRRILARLGARERAYRKHHSFAPPPSIAFGVGLSYAPAG